MIGRETEPQVHFTRVPCNDPEVTVFGISGSLGPRARPYLERLIQECLRRELSQVVLDLSEVDSLGGGSARLLNEFVQRRAKRGDCTVFRVTSPTVRGFLRSGPKDSPEIFPTMSEAIQGVKALAAAKATKVAGSQFPEFGGVDRDSLVTLGELFGEPQLAPPLLSDEGETPEATRPSRESRADVRPEAVRSDAVLYDADQPEVIRSTAVRSDTVPREAPGPALATSPVVDAPTITTTDSSHIQQQVIQVLRDRSLASRAWVFHEHEDGHFYLVARNGTDFDRSFASSGPLVQRILQRHTASLLFDLCGEPLEISEEELLAELNCEVVVPLPAQKASVLVFLSKEQPGDEYSMEELQEIEEALASVAIRRATAAIGPGTRAAPLVAHADPAELFLGLDDVTAEEAAAVDAEVDAVVNAASMSSVLRPANGSVSAGIITPTQPVHSDRERQLRRNLTQMRDILHLSQDFDASFGTSRILEVLVLSAISVARVNTVLYFAHRRGEYRLTHHRGLGRESLRELRLKGDSSLIQAVINSERGVQVDSNDAVHEDEKIWARQHGLQFAMPFRFKDAPVGVLLLGNSNGVCDPDLEMMSYLMNQAALAYDRAQLYETLQDRTLGVVRGLVSLIESRNGYDCGSTEQVVRYAQALARETQYPTDHMRDLIYGAVLRDVGMLRVSETLLRSPQDLTADQWESIRRHPIEGSNIMKQMCFNDTAVDVVLHHHEAYNGEGYPMGLRGRAIPLGARIVAVAESYVKMTMDRPYRKALGRAEALESMAENWGLRYDPLIVDGLVRVVNFELSVGLKGDADLTRDLFGV